MKHLHEKNEQFQNPDKDILDTFDNPGVKVVQLTQIEFTSICPLTSQPDYATVMVMYSPVKLCLESKSLKLYLSAYRNFKGFAETITTKIHADVEEVLQCPVTIQTKFARRGGIDIESVATSE